MIGFPAGQRATFDDPLNKGLRFERITMKTEEEAKRWRAIYPDEQQDFRAMIFATKPQAPGELIWNSNKPNVRAVLQDNMERVLWLTVFAPDPAFIHYARWESPLVLVLGSRRPDTAPKNVERDPADEWRQLDDKALRRKATEIGVPNVKADERGEMLVARMKRHMESKRVPEPVA